MTTTETPTTGATSLDTVLADYVDLWNETDADARTELARRAFSDDGRLVDPLLDATGPQAIAAAVGGLQAQMPDHVLVRTSEVDVHHDLVRFTWTVSAPDGTVAVAGVDVVTLAEDGRIAVASAFFGDITPLA